MLAMFRACALAVRSLFLPGVLRHFLWPTAVAVAVWVATGLSFWGRLSRVLAGSLQRWPLVRSHLPASAVSEQGIATAIHWALYFLSLPLTFATSVLLLEWIALPMILEKVARVEYPHVERRRGGSQWASIGRTVVSFLIALGLIVVTLPLWLIPGFGAVFSLVLSAWLNYRSFCYDVLMNHADPGELRLLREQHRGRLLLLALGTGTLSLVPGVNLLTVPLTGLAFAHYLLRELERLRGADGDAPSGAAASA